MDAIDASLVLPSLRVLSRICAQWRSTVGETRAGLPQGYANISGRAGGIASFFASRISTPIERLKNSGLHFRNEVEVGPGGKQIQLQDPDGNPIDLFEPAK